MPLLTHDETAAASMARARTVVVADRPASSPTGGGPPEGPDGAKSPKSPWKRVRRWLWIVLGLAVIGPLLAFAIGWLIFPVPTAADSTAAIQTATFTFKDGSPIAVIRPQDANGNAINRSIVTLDKVPVPVRQAVMAAEDRTFYSNPGFDILGIGRAVFNQLTGGVGGGSTITQQYVKNATGQNQATLLRKYREVVISVKISKEQTKDQILENYLNTIYFGRGAYGIQAASQAYFGKNVGDLTVAQGAFLAGTIQSPSSTDVARSQARFNYVLDQMVQAGWITPAQRAQQIYPTLTKASAATGGVPGDDRYHIYEKAKQELQAVGITDDEITTEGLTVTTTIDPRNQKAAVDAVNQTMDGQKPNLRTALTAVDPTTGAIVAYYGGSNGLGTDYADGNIGRQPGSSFKPFVLAAALQANKGIGLGSMYDGSSGQTFPGLSRPIVNSDGDSCAMCNVKTAMTKSINTVFYRMAVDIGPQNVIDAAHQAGIPASQLTRPASGGIALGDQEVHPLDMASAYGTFAADGVHRDPYLVSKVVASDGRVLFDRATTPTGSQNAMPQQVACNVTNSMTDVASSSRISPPGIGEVAAKTGTVQLTGSNNQNKDTWTVGYTPTLSTAVWVGSDNSDPVQTKSGSPAYGRTLAGPIWQNFMSDYLKAAKQTDLPFSACEPMGTPIAAPTPTYTQAPPADQNQNGQNGNIYCDPNSGVCYNPDGSEVSGTGGGNGGGGNGNGGNGNGNGNGGGGNGGGGNGGGGNGGGGNGG
ncbi:transglycosylase domain-containing protein [Pseudonocardia sp.]|uniref:transglycosylase domain-containing protein n=1 Tax=Pseudonocardia sp. TaxID=60912 RepID=UPI0025D05891|nr:transglycosylase domain-containing protein [Pseudonocardia sp.]